MRQMRNLICTQGAAAAGVIGPAEYSGLEEGAIDDQLPAALEQVEQANSPLRPVELVLLLNQHPRHPPPLRGQRISGAGESLLFQEEFLPCSVPLLRRYGRWSLHCHMPFLLFV